MKRLDVFLLAIVIQVSLVVSHASAHYLWVTIDAKTGDHGTTNVYFEGGPGPGDGQYLDPFIERGTTWIRTVDSPKPKALEMEVVKQPGKRWLSAALPSKGPRSIDSYGKWGVYFYKNINKHVLLHYYARNLEATDHDDLHELGRAEQLDLDIVPHNDGDELELTVLWKGKPTAGCSVAIYGPQKFRETLKTDKNGRVTLTPKAGGTYRFQTKFEEDKSGTDDGKDYQLIRHQMRMLMKLPLDG